MIIYFKGVVKMKKQFGEYYLGLDIGTNSLGWAVTDLDYQLQRFNGKDMWGVRLFNVGETADARRVARCARRRLKRRNQRIDLLQEIFDEEISKVDKNFFQRLNDSKLYLEDKQITQTNTLFNDDNFKDKDYHKKYPTIYHLRKSIIDGEQVDIRLVYLAIHHILKKRGHFLFAGQSFENVESLKNAFEPLNKYLEEYFEFKFDLSRLDEVGNVLQNKKDGLRDKERKLKELLCYQKKEQEQMIKLMIGSTVSLKKIFAFDEDMELESDSICFKGLVYEEFQDKFMDECGDPDKLLCIDLLKAIYDWAILAEIKKGKKYLSFAKVDTFDKHKSDLAILKKVVKKHLDKDTYQKIFSKNDLDNNYVAYVAHSRKRANIKLAIEKKRCSQEDFCKNINSLLEGYNEEDADLQYIKDEAKSRTLLPKLSVSDNAVLPYQIHLVELLAILDSAAKYLPFLNKEDGDEITPAKKIEQIMTFRIPYYVGPLNTAHINSNDKKGHCWAVKNNNDKIYPWNFDDVVDKEQSAEKFIKRMTNKCTYIKHADVLPKSSLLYSKFMLLNELNNVCINGERLSVALKQEVFEKLFMKVKRVTKSGFEKFLLTNGHMSKDDILSGFDGDFKSTLSSYIDFKGILGSKVNDTKMVDTIINWITLFGESNDLLKNKIEKHYGNKLTKEEVKNIAKLKYKGWGRLSAEFLEDFTSNIPGVLTEQSIISALYNTQCNLMELLSSKYGFINVLEKYTKDKYEDTIDELEYNKVDELYLSPSVKRGVWQTLQVVEEIKHIMGREPKKIFIEVTRTDLAPKKRTKSRKELLLDLYKSASKEARDWSSELGATSESDFRNDKLYLYYTQMGRCMYTNENIELSELFCKGLDGKSVYDIDHIYPQSKVKDDSIDNRVLVKSAANKQKSDNYPLPNDFQEKCKKHWEYLLRKKFISQQKFDRLTRVTQLSDDEYAGFIARQIVETSQSNKAVADILHRTYAKSDVVYVKSINVSDFRKIYDFVKCREINDYHHAKDAYLNVVVGNVYHTKFTSNPVNFIKSAQQYSLKRMYDFDVIRGGITAWKSGELGSIDTVKNIMGRNRVLFTRYATIRKGALFDLNPVKKGKGQLPQKSNEDISKYGGYNSLSVAYMFLVEHVSSNKTIRTIECVPVMLVDMFEKDENALVKYCSEKLGLNNPRIVLKKIKLDTLFKINGVKLHLSSKHDKNYFLCKNATQLIVPNVDLNVKYSNRYTMEKYIKAISSLVTYHKNNKTPLIVHSDSSIDAGNNIIVYDELSKKLKGTVYENTLKAPYDKILAARDKFQELSLKDQVYTIYNMLLMFNCNVVKTDLEKVGVKFDDRILLNKKITNYQSVSIVHQSSTGLFEKEVDLLKI